MTVKEFNKCFYPQYSKALEFIRSIKFVLQNCDDNTRKMIEGIGWDEDTKEFLIDSINRTLEDARDSYKWNQSKWWKKDK